jgi:hypothetical protein
LRGWKDYTKPITIEAVTVETLPIDIKAQTVGNLKIDIAAQTLSQLNVNIAASAVTLNVAIQSSTVTLNVDVTNPALTVGQASPALSFDGVDDYVEVPASSSFNVADEITVTGWVKRAETLPWDMTVWRKDADHFLCVRTTKLPEFDLFIDGAWRYCTSPTTVDSGWHFIAGTYSALTDKTLRLYVDGILIKETALSGLSTYQIRQTLYVARIGNPFDTRYAKGLIDDVRVYNRALSASEIADLYNNPHAGPTQGLVLWLPMNEGVGTSVADQERSGQQRHDLRCDVG